MSASSVTGAGSQSSTQALLAQLQAGSSTGSTSTDPGSQLNQQFLTLLVAQMNNQDPLNPLDNTQLTSQLAQISTVSGINGVNASIGSLVTQFQQLETMQAAQLTGSPVLVAGNSMTLQAAANGAEAARFSANFASGANAATATIVNASGATVKTMQLGAQGSGQQNFTWDGTTDSGSTAPAGTYTFKLSASNNGAAVTTTSYGAQLVTGVTTDTSGAVQLQLSGGSTVALSDVKQFL